MARVDIAMKLTRDAYVDAYVAAATKAGVINAHLMAVPVRCEITVHPTFTNHEFGRVMTETIDELRRLEKLLAHEEGNMRQREEELTDARRRVENLEMQLSNATRAVEEVRGQIEVIRTVDRVEELENEVADLKRQLATRDVTRRGSWKY